MQRSKQVRRLAGMAFSSLVVGALVGCASQTPNHDVVVDRPSTDGTLPVSADAVFAAADIDGDGVLSPLEVEPLGLGGNWHTLDLDGNGRLARGEFRQQFASPLVQTSLRLPTDPIAGSVVSSDFMLPPEPPAQRYRPAPVTSAASASVTVPMTAPLVIPVLIDDQDAATINRAAENTGESNLGSGASDVEMPAN